MKEEPKENQDRIPSQITELGVYSNMHNHYTVQEQKYIFMLEVYDQEAIREVISQRAHHGELNLSPFTRTDSCRRLEVPFKALEPCKSHYRILEKALISIGNKPVELPYTQTDLADGKQKQHYKQMDYLFHYVGSILKGHVKYAVIDFPFTVMQYANHIDLGYHKIKPSLFLALHHQSSRRLYQLAETELKLGNLKFQPQYLFNYLTSQAKYKGVGNMCYTQLDVAIDELKAAYKQGLSNYYVTYEIKAKKNIVFKLTFQWAEKLSKKDLDKLDANRKNTTEVLHEHWKVEEWVAEDISRKITPADYDAVRQCFKNAYARMRKGDVSNPAGLIVYMLGKILKDD